MPSQLTQGAHVSLDVGPDAEPLLCRSVAFGGGDAVLAPNSAPDDRMRLEQAAITWARTACASRPSRLSPRRRADSRRTS